MASYKMREVVREFRIPSPVNADITVPLRAQLSNQLPPYPDRLPIPHPFQIHPPGHCGHSRGASSEPVVGGLVKCGGIGWCHEIHAHETIGILLAALRADSQKAVSNG